MGDIIAKATGLIIIILTAYILKQVGIFKKEDKNFLGGILLNINLPCVIISGFQAFEFDISLVVAVAICYFSSFIGIGIGYLVSRKKDKEILILHMMGTAGYNIGIFTIPFVSSFLSAEAVLCVLMFDIGNALMVFGTISAITLAVVNKEKTNPLPQILKKLFTTIPFLTYILTISIALLGIKLPHEIYIVTDIGADATAFLAMIMIGIMLELNINKEDFKDALSAILTRYGHALWVSVIIYFLPFDIEIRKALIIAMFSPMSTASLVFSEKMGCKPSLLGVFSSLNIFLSISIIIGIILYL